jgi:hypothetical protein
MIGLWHAAVGDWLHGCVIYVRIMFSSIYFKTLSCRCNLTFFQKEKVFVLINPPTNYIICRTVMSCSQFLNYVHNFYGGFNNAKLRKQFLHKTTDFKPKSG